MPTPLFQFTQVTKLIAETFGDPGMRTFRINVDSASSTAKIWVEKEQLSELCSTMNQLFHEATNIEYLNTSPLQNIEAPPLSNIEFKPDKIALGYDKHTSMFIIDAYSPQEDFDNPTLRIWVEANKVETFCKEGLLIVSSGRLICELCKKPKEPNGHHCDLSNGHSKSVEDLI
jgi:uncharacterized repeat protein (TIGR03847 family)